VIKSSC